MQRLDEVDQSPKVKVSSSVAIPSVTAGGLAVPPPLAKGKLFGGGSVPVFADMRVFFGGEEKSYRCTAGGEG